MFKLYLAIGKVYSSFFFQASILAEFQTVLKSADDMKDKLNMPPE